MEGQSNEIWLWFDSGLDMAHIRCGSAGPAPRLGQNRAGYRPGPGPGLRFPEALLSAYRGDCGERESEREEGKEMERERERRRQRECSK